MTSTRFLFSVFDVLDKMFANLERVLVEGNQEYGRSFRPRLRVSYTVPCNKGVHMVVEYLWNAENVKKI